MLGFLFLGLIVFVIFLIRNAIFNFTREKLLNEKEKDEWIGAIGRSIVQASKTYQKDYDGSSSDEDSD